MRLTAITLATILLLAQRASGEQAKYFRFQCEEPSDANPVIVFNTTMDLGGCGQQLNSNQKTFRSVLSTRSASTIVLSDECESGPCEGREGLLFPINASTLQTCDLEEYGSPYVEAGREQCCIIARVGVPPGGEAEGYILNPVVSIQGGPKITTASTTVKLLAATDTTKFSPFGEVSIGVGPNIGKSIAEKSFFDQLADELDLKERLTIDMVNATGYGLRSLLLGKISESQANVEWIPHSYERSLKNPSVWAITAKGGLTFAGTHVDGPIQVELDQGQEFNLINTDLMKNILAIYSIAGCPVREEHREGGITVYEPDSGSAECRDLNLWMKIHVNEMSEDQANLIPVLVSTYPLTFASADWLPKDKLILGASFFWFHAVAFDLESLVSDGEMCRSHHRRGVRKAPTKPITIWSYYPSQYDKK